MKINNISFTNSDKKRNPILNSKLSGYVATAGVGAAIISGISKNKTLRKNHKYTASFSAVTLIWHIFSVEYNKHLYKMKKRAQ